LKAELIRTGWPLEKTHDRNHLNLHRPPRSMPRSPRSRRG
jgi:hypothetical protein